MTCVANMVYIQPASILLVTDAALMSAYAAAAIHVGCVSNNEARPMTGDAGIHFETLAE